MKLKNREKYMNIRSQKYKRGVKLKANVYDR